MNTLGSLIASKDFTGYKVTGACWSIQADQIEQLLYQRDYGDWSQGDDHETRFFEAETLTAVEINTWICTDTHVGLEILCINGTPFALSWQTARKNDREVMLINKEGYVALQDAWERHRGEKKTNNAFVSAQTLGMPIADTTDTAYTVDTSTGLENLSLAAHSVAQWMEDIKAQGGLDTITNLDTLKSCIQGVEFDIKMHARIVENTEAYLAQNTDKDIKGRRSLQKDMGEYKERITLLTSELLTPLQNRLAALNPN